MLTGKIVQKMDHVSHMLIPQPSLTCYLLEPDFVLFGYRFIYILRLGVFLMLSYWSGETFCDAKKITV
jgi:hypothetical protein